MCAVRKNSLPGELATALSSAVPNKQSARDALNLAQTAALCTDYGARENAIRLLAERGDAKAQRILGHLFAFGGSTINKDRAEGMAWYRRAGAQGDLFAQKYYRDLADKVNDTDRVWSSEDYKEAGHWHFSNCPALC
jgi:TPR repeat protein